MSSDILMSRAIWWLFEIYFLHTAPSIYLFIFFNCKFRKKQRRKLSLCQHSRGQLSTAL